MKCPKCGINYDDSDRECPMCGAPKPLFAKDKSQLAKTTARPASNDNQNTDAMGSILDLGSKQKNSWSKPKKDGKNIIIVVVIIILISVLPALITNIASIISYAPQNMVQVEPEQDDISIDVTKLYDLNNAVEVNIFNDGTYYITGYDFDEWGYITIYEYDTSEVLEFETFLLDNGIDFDNFNIITAVLTPDNSQQDKYILIAESKNDEQTFFYDLNSDVDWLEDGNFVEGVVWS